MATVADSNHRDYKHTELQKKADLRKVKKHNHGVKTPLNMKKQEARYNNNVILQGRRNDITNQGNYHKTS